MSRRDLGKVAAALALGMGVGGCEDEPVNSIIPGKFELKIHSFLSGKKATEVDIGQDSLDITLGYEMQDVYLVDDPKGYLRIQVIPHKQAV